MVSASHFNQPKKDWSARKHAVLKEYLRPFCTALSRQGTIWYVDGYAGAGTYRDPDNPNAPVEIGSPVLAAQIAEQLPYDIRCFNVEEDAENFASLVEATAQYPHVSNENADFNDVVDRIIDTVRGQPAFFFLDPFGTKDLPMTGLVDKIAVKPDPTDILVRYATETVRRLAGAYEKDFARRDAHARNLDNWFRGDRWQQIVAQFPAGQDRDSELLHYYLEQLVSISGGRLRFATAYPIRTLEDNVKYHLVFATGDRLGIKLMSDILYKAENQFVEDRTLHKEQKRGASQMGLFDITPEQQFKQHIKDIEDAVLQIALAGQTNWNFEALYLELVMKRGWFARMFAKEFRMAIKNLYDEGKVEHVSSGRAWGKDTYMRIVP